MKLTYVASVTALLVALCFFIVTDTPLIVVLALWLAFCLGALFGIEGYKKVGQML